MNRRDFLLSTGSVVAVAGCVGEPDDGLTQGEETNSDGEASSESSDQTQGVASVAQIQRVTVSSIERGDESQRVSITLTDVERGAEFPVYINIASFEEANIDNEELGVIADIDLMIGGMGWVVSDAEISSNKEIIKITVAVEDDDQTDDQGGLEINLIELRTDDIEHGREFQHTVTVATDGEDEPDFDAGEMASYEIIDPEELENVLTVLTDNIRVGENEQSLQGSIDHATSDIPFRIDITPLREVGVDIEDADVEIEAIENNLTDDVEDVEVSMEEVVDGIVRLHFTTEADVVRFSFRVINLDTEDAEATDGITYPIYTGEQPEEPEESRSFSITGAVA